MRDFATDSNALDPQRPWLTDQRDLPSNLNWLDTLFNPLGKSPKLHFTRVWTVLFFLQFFFVVGMLLIITVASLAGADTKGLTILNGYATAVVFIVTTLISFIIHVRRLNDAGKWSILGFIVLIPLIVAMAVFIKDVGEKSAAYDKLYAERTVYLADPDAWREQQLVKRREIAEKQRLEREANSQANGSTPAASRAASSAVRSQSRGSSSRGRGRGGAGGPGGWNRGPSADKPLPSQEEFILRPSVGSISSIIMGISALIMLWSLLWVARAPIPKKYLYPKMDLKKVFTSFHGRIGRHTFWISWSILSLVGISISVAPILAVSMIFGTVSIENFDLIRKILIPANAVFFFIFCAYGTKRLHDLGMSGKWHFLPFVPLVFCIIPLGYLMLGLPLPIIATIVLNVLVGVSVLASVSLFFFMGFAPPKLEDNEHGPAPELNPDYEKWEFSVGRHQPEATAN